MRVQWAVPIIASILILGTISVQQVYAPDHDTGSGTTFGVAIPDWVRNNFEWYVNGQIDEKTLLTSMNWMFDNNIMHLSEKAALEVADLREENKRLRSGVGLYIAEGKINEDNFESITGVDVDRLRGEQRLVVEFWDGPDAGTASSGDFLRSDLASKGIIITGGIPSDLAAKGIIIIDTMPDQRATGNSLRAELEAKGIIITGGMPSDLEAKGIIVIDTMPSDSIRSDLAAKGIIIVEGMPSDVAEKGIVIVGGTPSDLAAKGIIVIDTMPGATSFEQMMSPQSGTKSDTSATPGQTFFYFVKAVRDTHWEDSTNLLATIRGIDTTDNVVDYLQEIFVLCSIAMDKEIQALQTEVMLLGELTEMHSDDTTDTAAGDTRYTGEPTEDKIAEWLTERLVDVEQKIASLQTGVNVCEEKISGDDALTELTDWPISQKKDLEEIEVKSKAFRKSLKKILP